MYWNDLSSHLKAVYGTKVYKLSLSSGCTCPNRDGTLGSRGCIFCDGAGTFAAAGDIRQQRGQMPATSPISNPSPIPMARWTGCGSCIRRLWSRRR